ncbi:sugar ABC transporter substrate-binding protein [Armatimonas sp.]|uniref:ABC transporter substrate-binding protein n=1 Tax=Armatimonas sp. TaxID=1872638 RepID=UPI00286A1CB4|nr:sugar ABC transporter substrate-binding protein [Armatimonas sp.]
MRFFFLVSLGTLMALSLLAWKLEPRFAPTGKTPLVWVSDDNPQRKLQIATFNAQSKSSALRLDPNNSGMQKIIVQSLAGVGPDLFDTNAANLPVMVAADVAWDITDELKKRGIALEREVWPSTLPLIRCNGRFYGVPANACTNALFINKKLFDKAGLPYPSGPWTWEQFLPLAQKLTIRDARGKPQQFGFLMDWWTWPQFVIQWGGQVYSDDGTRCTLDSPEAIAGVQFLHDLIYKYKVMPSPVEEAAMATQGGWGAGSITQFGGNRAAMGFGGRWWLCTLRKKEQFPGLSLTVAEAPHHKERVFLAYGRTTAINKQSPRREQALEYLLHMTGPAFNQGINAQADALAAFPKYCEGERYLHNPEFPEEDKNDVWRDVMAAGKPNPPSPFISSQLADRIMGRQLDLVKNDQKPVADALKAAASEINAEIQKTLQRDPELKKRYDTLKNLSPAPLPGARPSLGKGSSS